MHGMFGVESSTALVRIGPEFFFSFCSSENWAVFGRFPQQSPVSLRSGREQDWVRTRVGRG